MTVTLAVLAVVLPFVSVGLGAWITYRLNVRDRARTRVEGVYHDAIAAVAVATATRHYIKGVERWDGASDSEWGNFLAAIRRDSTERHLRAVADARIALARASAYLPALRIYYEGAGTLDVDRADEIVGLLRGALDGVTAVRDPVR